MFLFYLLSVSVNKYRHATSGSDTKSRIHESQILNLVESSISDRYLKIVRQQS